MKIFEFKSELIDWNLWDLSKSTISVYSAFFDLFIRGIYLNNYSNSCNCGENDFLVSETISSKKFTYFWNSENETDDSDDRFETQNLYAWECESDNLDFIFQNYILLTFKKLVNFNPNWYFFNFYNIISIKIRVLI